MEEDQGNNKQRESDDNSEKNGRKLAQGRIEQTEQMKGKAVSFNFHLLCTSRKVSSTSTSSRTISLAKLPESVGELKEVIQNEFNIPVYDQKLSLECSLMEDGESLDFYRLKDGDQITVEYTGKAQVECVFLLIAALREALDFLKYIENELKSQLESTSFDFRSPMSDTLRVKDIDQCAQQLVSGDDKMSNAKFFLKNGGLHLIEEIHTILLGQPWHEVYHMDLMYLEKCLLAILHIILLDGADVVNYACLNNIIGSFLRVPLLSDRSISVPDNRNMPIGSKYNQKKLLADVIVMALGCLSNIAEYPEHQILLVSNDKVMKQFIGCVKTPDQSFSLPVRVRVLNCLENLCHTSGTHQCFSTEELFRVIFHSSNKLVSPTTPYLEGVAPHLCLTLDSDLVKFFGSMMIAQLVLTRVAVIPSGLLNKITTFLDPFVRNVDVTVLHKWAVKAYGFRRQDIFPVMSLVYSPLTHTSEKLIDLLCVEVGILGLQVILGGENERQVLIKQGLLDYLVCLQWFIPEMHNAYPRTRRLLRMVGAHVPLQPPSLNNIVRAKLAATSCGLKKAMYSDCHQLVYELAVRTDYR